MVFVQYSVGHHDDDEKQASPWVEKSKLVGGQITWYRMSMSQIQGCMIGYDLAVSCAAALLTG